MYHRKTIHFFTILSFFSFQVLFGVFTSLETEIKSVQKRFNREIATEIESELLKHVIFRRNNILIDKNIAKSIVDAYTKQTKKYHQIRQRKMLNTIKTPEELSHLPLVQLNVNAQKANSCGFHALYNLKAIEDLIMTGEQISSRRVKELSRMYLDGYLLEIGKREEELIDLAWDEKPAELAQNADLRHFFLIQYYHPQSEIVKRGLAPEVAIVYGGDTFSYYTEFDNPIRAAEEDFKKSVKNNRLTVCVLGIPGHYTAYAIVHYPRSKPFIIFMNSISFDGINSIPITIPSANASVAEYLATLISSIK